MTETIRYSRRGHLGKLLLNNPERHNALGREQLTAIDSYLQQIESDPAVRALIVSGAGEKTFCAGASLRELGPEELAGETLQQVTARLAALPIPTICALNGNVFGGGAELAVSCDFRIGVDGMRLRVPAASLGLCYPAQGVLRFVECLGASAARRLLLAAEELDAEALLRIGFLDHLVLRENLEQSANDLGQRIAGLAPLAVRGMKQLLRQAGAACVDMEQARALSRRCLESEDLQEGLAAQREKREPRFRGN